MNFISQLLGNLKKEKCILLLKIILAVDLADMHLISKYNEEIRYLF